jgi:rhomboid-like protein
MLISIQIRRLLPSFLFAAAVAYTSYLFAKTWTPPDRATRLMPSETIPRATILGIIYANAFVLTIWRFPPAWRILNRYFTTTPAVVRPFSNLGNIFSHHTLSHFGINMLLLWIVGNNLVEQIGRGDFLALYISSGVVGSVASLTSLVLRNVLISSSLGASGAVAGVVAAFCTINPE